MSPLGRALLALACAALLSAACADFDALNSAQYCNSIWIKKKWWFDPSEPASQQQFTVTHGATSLVVIPDLATKPGGNLVAQKVYACNWEGTGAPDLAPPPAGHFSPVQVVPAGKVPKKGLKVYVVQYAEPFYYHHPNHDH